MDEGVVAVVVFDPVPERRDELVAAVERGVRRVQLLPGCRYYSLTETAAGELLLLERWDSLEDLQYFIASELAAELMESYRGLLRSPPIPQVVEAHRAR
jgi:quinol monooxygenase YgiN